MRQEWNTKCRTVSSNGIRSFSRLRIAEAYEAIVARMGELGETSESDRHKLDNTHRHLEAPA
jgi:hypothetical protein